MEGSTFSIRKAIAFGWTKSIEHLWLLIKAAFAFIVVKLVLALGYLPIGLLMYLTEGSKLAIIPLGLLIAYTLAVFLTFLSMGYLGLPRILLDLYEHNTSHVSRMFSVFSLIVPYIGASILFGVIVLIPIILAYGLLMLTAYPHLLFGGRAEFGVAGMPLLFAIIVFIASFFVGIYLATRLIFYSLALIDKRLGATSCLQYSWKITQGSVLKLLLFSFVLLLTLWGLFALAGLNLFGLSNAFDSGWYSLAFISGLLLAASILCIMLAIPMVMLAYIYVYKQLSERFDRHSRIANER